MSSTTRIIFGLFNIIIPVWAGFSIYHITHENIIYAIAGWLAISMIAPTAPLLLPLLLPAFEYFYSGSLTNYSFIYIGLVLLNMLVIFGIMILGKDSFE